MKNIALVLHSFLCFIFLSCTSGIKYTETDTKENDCHSIPLLELGADPWAMYHDGYYYYMQAGEHRLLLWKTKDITKLKDSPPKEIWLPTDRETAYHLWGAEIHNIHNKWYVYYAADNGNTDNHQIYVLECDSKDPFEGEFIMKGCISTDKERNWAIHANVFEHKDELYMIWSGWQTRRIETETQCIYIAKMSNPWTLSSDRVLISKPELEWERQWINPDGSRTAYPIYVNEAPQYFYTKKKDKVLIYYSASGSWTPYCCLGMLSADANSNLLTPSSWVKNKTPAFKQNLSEDMYSTGSVSFVPSPNGDEYYFLYHARRMPNNPLNTLDSRAPFMQKMEWNEQGFPKLGVPISPRL